MDICDVILNDHHEQRRMFALMDGVPLDEAETLGATWERLAILLEVHAAAEEQFFYPQLLDEGEGTAAEGSPNSETRDAIKDHNEIRGAIRKARACEIGSNEWWQHVRDARTKNSNHMGEEERGALADLRRHGSIAERDRLGVEFAAFEDTNARGSTLATKIPRRTSGPIHDATISTRGRSAMTIRVR